MVIKYVYGALFLLFVGGDGTVASDYEKGDDAMLDVCGGGYQLVNF